MIDAAKLVKTAHARLKVVARPEDAPAMQAYMKTTQPFWGVKKPAREAIEKDLAKTFVPENQADYERAVLALWSGKRREEQYLALNFAIRQRAFVRFESMGLYERMIREGQWWDTVDAIVSDLVSRVYLKDRKRMEPILAKWIDDENMWIRRTAILAHMQHKAETDEKTLYAHCLKRAHEKEFFIRKAIGWALRHHSKTNPKAIEKFVRANEAKLSPLSVREALKVIERARSRAK